LASYGKGEFLSRLPISSIKGALKFNAVDILCNLTSGKIEVSEITGQANTENLLQTRLAFWDHDQEKFLTSSNAEPDESKK